MTTRNTSDTPPLRFRVAHPSEAEQLAPLLYSAGPEICDYVFAFKRTSALPFLNYEIGVGRGFCAAANIHVAETTNGIGIGTMCLSSQLEFIQRSAGTCINLMRFFGIPNTMATLKRFSRIARVMPCPRPRELYLSHLAVHPDFQGMGVGRAMLEHAFICAKQRDYQRLRLDVAIANHSAMALYTRHGFSPIQQNQIKYPHCRIPDSRTLCRTLNLN